MKGSSDGALRPRSGLTPSVRKGTTTDGTQPRAGMSVAGRATGSPTALASSAASHRSSVGAFGVAASSLRPASAVVGHDHHRASSGTVGNWRTASELSLHLSSDMEPYNLARRGSAVRASRVDSMSSLVSAAVAFAPAPPSRPSAATDFTAAADGGEVILHSFTEAKFPSPVPPQNASQQGGSDRRPASAASTRSHGIVWKRDRVQSTGAGDNTTDAHHVSPRPASGRERLPSFALATASFQQHALVGSGGMPTGPPPVTARLREAPADAAATAAAPLSVMGQTPNAGSTHTHTHPSPSASVPAHTSALLARRPGSPGAVAWSPPRPAAPQADVAALLNSSAQARRRVRPAQPSPAELSTVFTHFRIKSGSTAGVPDAAVMDEHAAAGSATVETEAPSLTNNPASGAPLTAPQPAAAFLAAQCHAPYALGFSKLLSSLSVALPAESAALVSSADTAAYATAKLRPMARTDSTSSLSSSGTLGLRGRPQIAGAVARGVAAQNHAAREGERRADAARSGGASPSIRLVLPHPSSLPRQGSASQLRSTDALVGVATGQRLSHDAHRVVDVTAAGTAALAHVPTRPSPTATMTNGDSGHGQDERAVLHAPNEGSAPHRSAERKDEFNDSKEDILEDEGDEGDDSASLGSLEYTFSDSTGARRRQSSQGAEQPRASSARPQSRGAREGELPTTEPAAACARRPGSAAPTRARVAMLGGSISDVTSGTVAATTRPRPFTAAPISTNVVMSAAANSAPAGGIAGTGLVSRVPAASRSPRRHQRGGSVGGSEFWGGVSSGVPSAVATATSSAPPGPQLATTAPTFSALVLTGIPAMSDPSVALTVGRASLASPEVRAQSAKGGARAGGSGTAGGRQRPSTATVVGRSVGGGGDGQFMTGSTAYSYTTAGSVAASCGSPVTRRPTSAMFFHGGAARMARPGVFQPGPYPTPVPGGIVYSNVPPSSAAGVGVPPALAGGGTTAASLPVITAAMPMRRPLSASITQATPAAYARGISAVSPVLDSEMSVSGAGWLRIVPDAMAWSADPSHSPLHISTHGHDPAASPLLYTERSAHVGTGVEFFGDVGGWDTHDTLHSGASPLLPPPAAPPARARPQSAAPVFTTQQQPLPQQVHGHGQSAMPSSGAAARRPQSALPVARSRQLIVPADAMAAA